MRTLPLAILPLTVLLSACPDDPPAQNPPRLYLALLGGETMVQLVPEEPDPF
ncbi:MAG: hypothetical protein H6708_17935 [Kofleriaceae bacterium]|nr:hypothetical protein [Kofleriaceae bacterium]